MHPISRSVAPARFGALVRVAAFAGFLVVLGAGAPVAAEWRGSIEGGTTLGGDGGTATLVRATLVDDSRPFSQRFFADWVRRGGDEEDAWALGYVPRHHFSDTLYGFAETGLRGDGELGIDSQVRALAGVGTRASPGAVTLYAEVAAGAVRTDDERVSAAFGDAADDPTPGAADDEAEVSPLGVLRGGAGVVLAETVRLGADADAEWTDAASELRADLSAAVRLGAGSVALTVRTRRRDADGLDARSVTDTFVGYSLGF